MTEALGATEPTDPTPFGCLGDHCPWCGQDWKREHDPECERVADPARADAIVDRYMRDYHDWESAVRASQPALTVTPDR